MMEKKLTEHVRPNPDASVSINDEGFEIRLDDQLVTAVCWIAVRTISAYMHVTTSGSLHCLVFACDGPVERVEVISSSEGWAEFKKRAESHFRGFMPAWESRIEQRMGHYPQEIVVWEQS